MARVGLGLAVIAAAALMLGATPASACEAHAKTAEAKDNQTAQVRKDARDTPQAQPAPTTAPAPAPEAKPASAPRGCLLHPAEDALAGKCSCGGPSDCTCKKNDCQCPKCGKRARQAGESQDV